MAENDPGKGRYSSRLSLALDLIKSGLANPGSVPLYLKDQYRDQKRDFKSEVYRRRHGIPRQKRSIHELLDRDEFVLVILDACRYDVFEELSPEFLSGSLSRVWSSGNWTQQWMSRTWGGTYDLTYVSTTPYTFDYAHEEFDSRYRPSEHFAEVVDVIGTEWNPVLSTTPPEPVTDITLAHVSSADAPRVVVHYMQPHAPYIGNTRLLQWDMPDAEIDALLDQFEGGAEDSGESVGDGTGSEQDTESLTLAELVRSDLEYHEERQLKRENYESIDSQLEHGKISKDHLHEAYRDNLRRVLGEVERLVSYLDCPVVVTADHGEHLGHHFDEIPELTHPDLTHPVLREVPWFVVSDESKGHRELSTLDTAREAHEPDGEAGPSEEAISDRLEALGYK